MKIHRFTKFCIIFSGFLLVFVSSPSVGHAELSMAEINAKWTKWEKRFQRAARITAEKRLVHQNDTVEESANPSGNSVDARQFGEVECTVSGIATRRGEIMNLAVTSSTGDEKWNQFIKSVVSGLAGTSVMRFPSGVGDSTHRVSYTLGLSPHGSDRSDR
jgi:hypothetical protein